MEMDGNVAKEKRRIEFFLFSLFSARVHSFFSFGNLSFLQARKKETRVGGEWRSASLQNARLRAYFFSRVEAQVQHFPPRTGSAKEIGARGFAHPSHPIPPCTALLTAMSEVGWHRWQLLKAYLLLGGHSSEHNVDSSTHALSTLAVAPQEQGAPC